MAATASQAHASSAGATCLRNITTRGGGDDDAFFPCDDDDEMDGRDYLTSVLSDDHVPQELRAYYESFRELRDQRLWYQLTLQVESFLRHPASQERPRHIDLYEHFIRTFARHINHLVLASMGVIVSRQYEHAADALAFLQRLATETDQPETQDAHVLLSMEAAHFQLLLGDLSGTRAAMDRCAKLLDSFDAVEPVVHASFYRVCGNYHKAKAEYADYYRNYFLFLACIHVDAEMSKAEQVQCAHDLSISALLGDTIYNFGELLLHPILASLQGSEYAWLADLLFAFNAGDMGRFEALLPRLASEPMLQAHVPFLRQKLCLMALIESLFHRSMYDRTLPFTSLASETRIPVDEVEHLVMKALCLGLVRGSIDQVAQLVRITWVQPRVLDTDQMQALLRRLTDWSERVDRVATFVHQQSPDLFPHAL